MILFYNNLKSICRISNKTNTVMDLSNMVLNKRVRMFATETTAVQKISIRTIKSKKQYGFGSWFLLVIPVSSFGLGVWQIFRKLEKDKINEKLLEKTRRPISDLPQDLNELKDLEFCEVRVKGRFDHSKEIYMGPRPLVSKDSLNESMSLLSKSKAGYLVVTPFTLSDRNLTILVNRGWVPSKNKLPHTRPEGQITGEVELIGLVRNSEIRKPLGAKNNVEKGQWVYRDLNKMSMVTGAAPVFIDAVESSSVPGGPVGGQTVVKFPNDHFSYIVTWFSLSGASGYMWYLKHLQKLPVIV